MTKPSCRPPRTRTEHPYERMWEAPIATSVSDEVMVQDRSELLFTTSGEPWLTRVEWFWTLLGLGLLIALLRFAIDHP